MHARMKHARMDKTRTEASNRERSKYVHEVGVVGDEGEELNLEALYVKGIAVTHVEARVLVIVHPWRLRIALNQSWPLASRSTIQKPHAHIPLLFRHARRGMSPSTCRPTHRVNACLSCLACPPKPSALH